MSVDPVAAIRAVLFADTAVKALVDTRVWGGAVPEKPVNEVKLMPRAGVVLKPSGGPGVGEGSNEFGKQRIDTFCYGSTPQESWLVYLAVYAALKQMPRQKIAGLLLHSAEASSKGSQGIDPLTQWDLTLASFIVLASEVAAA